MVPEETHSGSDPFGLRLPPQLPDNQNLNTNRVREMGSRDILEKTETNHENQNLTVLPQKRRDTEISTGDGTGSTKRTK